MGFWRWIFLPLEHPPQRWWWREDRSIMARFMDFYCERIYPVLMVSILSWCVVQLIRSI